MTFTRLPCTLTEYHPALAIVKHERSPRRTQSPLPFPRRQHLPRNPNLLRHPTCRTQRQTLSLFPSRSHSRTLAPQSRRPNLQHRQRATRRPLPTLRQTKPHQPRTLARSRQSKIPPRTSIPALIQVPDVVVASCPRTPRCRTNKAYSPKPIR